MRKKIAIFIDNDFYFTILFCKIFLKKNSNSQFIFFVGQDFINLKRILITFFSLPILEFYKIFIKVYKNKNLKVFENYLLKNKIEFHYSNELDTKDIQKILKKNKIKNILSVINSKIFKKKHFKKYNIYNLHLGQIPNYKGIVPVINAIIRKEKIFYSSIFLISFKGIDTGKLIMESSIMKKNSKNIFNLYTKLYKVGFRDMFNLSKKILMNKKIKILRTVQKTDGNYYKYPKLVNIINISKYF